MTTPVKTAYVTIDSGGFPLMRNIDIAHQPSRNKVYTKWITAFSYNVPDAMASLADVIEDVYRYELWKDRQLDTPEALFENLGLFDMHLDEAVTLIRELREKAVEIGPDSDLSARSRSLVRVLGRDRAHEFATLLVEATGPDRI